MKTFSVTIWIVRPGREDDFIRQWRELAAITMRTVGSRKDPTRLLRDRDQANRFISTALWDSASVLLTWRAGPEYRERVGRMHEVLENVTPMTLDDVSR